MHRLREFEVRPASMVREAGFGALFALTVCALAGLRFYLLSTKAENRELAAYQRADSVIAGPDRSLYRSLRSAVPDIIALREREGIWPEADLLRQEWIPPFAPQILPKSLRAMRWIGYDGGSWVDYLGQFTDRSKPLTFILRLIDLNAGYHPHPHPGINYEATRTVAYQIWYHPTPARAYPGERLPEDGWLWLIGPGDRLPGKGMDSPRPKAPDAIAPSQTAF